MNFEVNKDEFKRAIIPSIEVANKNTLKDFKYENLITIKAEKDQVVLLSYGGNLSLISPLFDSKFRQLGYECEEEGQVTVYADDLLTFMESVPSSYDTIKVFLDSNLLKIANASKNDESKKKTANTVRSMPILTDAVRPPNLGTKFDQDIKMDREVFVNGVNSILFAPSYEEKQFSYMCMLFEVKMGADQEIRFSAGTGGRFAMKIVKGKNIVLNKNEAKMIFPKNSLSSVAKILANASQPYVSIKSVGVDKTKHIPEHFMLEIDDMILCIYGLDHYTKYPDLSNVLTHKYSNRVFSSLEDWKSVAKSIEGTKHRWNDSIHNTEVTIEEDEDDESVFRIAPQTPNANPTFIGMDKDDCFLTGEKPWFRCNSDYLREIVVHGEGKGNIQLNFESQEIIEGVTDEKQIQKLMKPVLIKFPENVDGVKNIVDNFYIFFSISTM